LLSRGEFILRNVSGKVLDVGFGHGYPWTLTLFAEKPDVAVDLRDERIELCWVSCKASEVPPEGFLLADAHHLPLKDGSFDSVCLSDVLEHVKDPRRALLEALRVAKEKVIVTVPYGKHESHVPRYHRFDRRLLRRIFRELEVEKLEFLSTEGWKGFCAVITDKPSPRLPRRGMCRCPARA